MRFFVSGHDVEIISQGEVIDPAWTFYPSFAEPEPFHQEVVVHYASILPVRRLNGLWSNARTLHLLKARHRVAPFDLVIIFNLKGPRSRAARWAVRRGLR